MAILCFQMCFEFDSVFLTFIKYSDEHVIKVLSLFFNIVFSVFQTFFKLERAEQRRRACQQVAHSHASHAVHQQ